MKLSEYSKSLKHCLEFALETLQEEGEVVLSGDVDTVCQTKQEVIDHFIELIVIDEAENDCGYPQAFINAGIVDQVLTGTSILGKVAGMGSIWG